MTLRPALASLLLLGAASTLAAGRVPYGGQLRVVHTSSAEPEEPALADSPTEATLHGLLSRPACRLGPDGQTVPTLARELSRPSPQVVRLTLPSPEQAGALARAWMRLTRSEAPSPYRALLYPVHGEARQLSASGDTLELALSFPWPDLERALCHPMLAPPRSPAALGPFAPAGPGTVEARLSWPEGRPYLDALRLRATDERGLRRLWTSREAEVVLGAMPDSSTVSGAALYATYLAWSPRRVPANFRRAVESAIDREDLTRLFVRGPAVPMPHLLPPALLSQPAAPSPAPPPSQSGRKVTLLYDSGSEDQRAVAERLQVKLYERGYVVALEPLSRGELRARWAKGDYELMLHSLLLPPVPGPALAVVLDAGGRKDLLGVELPRIGSQPDEAARDEKARARALALAPSVPMLPLYAQGLALKVAPEVAGLDFDAQGLPVLDGAFLQPVPTGVLGARR